MRSSSIKSTVIGIVVVIVTTLLCLLAGEVLLRLTDGWSLKHYRLVTTPERQLTLIQRSAAPDTWSIAQRHLEKLPLAAGVELSWFNKSPADPAVARQPVDPKRLARHIEYLARDLYGPQANYVWNRRFVENNTTPSWQHYFRSMPISLEVFEPSTASERPVYRFPPREKLPSGMLTNHHGWRGDELQHTEDHRRVLLAFVGASTTQDPPSARFSHPELVGFWLNHWAKAANIPLRFDVINAGREGINSQDIAEIVVQEIQPLQPDFIIYMEGANQTYSYRDLVRMADGGPIPPQPKIPPSLLDSLARCSAIAARIQRAVRENARGLTEPLKPTATISRERLTTDPVRSDNYRGLPLSLDVICSDLDRINRIADACEGRLFVSSFTWFDLRGVPLDPRRHQHIYSQLNSNSWPLSNADWHELMEYQNEVFAAWCAAKGAGFLDVARHLPRDPDLFIDPIHVNEEGVRVRAWIVFNLLQPRIMEAHLAGRLPRTATPREFAYGDIRRINRPVTSSSRPSIQVAQDSRPAETLVSRHSFEKTDADATISITDDRLRITAGRGQWSRALAFPLKLLPTSPHPVGTQIEMRLKVLAGSIGIGLLRKNHPETYKREVITAAQGEVTVVFVLEAAPEISHVLVENALGDASDESIVDIISITTRRP